MKISSSPPHFPVVDVWGNKHTVRCEFFSKSGEWLVSIDKERFSDWELFIEDQRILHKIYLSLCKCKTEKEIYKELVELCLVHLDIDRVGILLISIEDNTMKGSWGTDENGKVVDQSDFLSNLNRMSWGVDAISKKGYIAVNYDMLWARSEKIGRGWNALSTFFDGDQPIGWVVCDNYFSQKPLLPWKKEIIGELGRITGQLVSKFRQECRLQDMVDERTRELRDSQKNLVEAEKLASLGGLVAGVAHELNTPLGIALTASSFTKTEAENIKKKIENDNLTKNKLLRFVESQIDSGQVAQSSLERASGIVRNFKQLASDQTAENMRSFTLYELLDAIYSSIKLNYKEITINFVNKIDKDLSLFSYPGDFIQIFTHLIINSISHGFEGMASGSMAVISTISEENLFLQFSDNGIGIKEDDIKKVFEPFYTTKRHKGDTGLGLTIIHNMIVKLGGIIDVKPANPGLDFNMTFDLKKLTTPDKDRG